MTPSSGSRPASSSPVARRADGSLLAARLRWYHWCTLALSALSTLGVGALVEWQIEQRNRVRFEREAAHIVELIIERLARYEDALWAGVGTIRALERPLDLGSWRAFSDTLHLDTKYPGINGIGVIHRVPVGELADYVAVQRRTRPAFAVHPERVDDVYLPITFIEPEAPNLAAVGLDVAHESNRLLGARSAMDSGLAQVTGPIVLVQDDQKTPGFLFYAPFYRDGDRAADDVVSRRETFRGLVYAPFIVSRLMEGVLSRDTRDVGLRLTDGDTVLYDEHVATAAEFDPSPLYRRSVESELYGRLWVFDIRSTRVFRASSGSLQPLAILIAGGALNVLLLALFLSMSRTNRQAMRIADELTRELREESTKLERSNADLELFATVASHDLQEPLRMVGGFTRLLQQRYSGTLDADADRYIEFAVDGVTRMQTLLNELLKYARLGDASADVERVDATAVCRDAVDGLTVLLADRDGRVDIDELPTLRVDASQLLQVFQNLVANALKYRAEDRPPRIDVSASDDGDTWRFSVRDNGVGIAPEYLDRVFVMFQRLHDRESHEGSGIGLAICRKIVHRHGGDIWIESERGIGTTVNFTIAKHLARDDPGGRRVDAPRGESRSA